jgi:hypothetical protein
MNDCVGAHPSDIDSTYLAKYVLAPQVPRGYSRNGSTGDGFVHWIYAVMGFLDRDFKRVDERPVNLGIIGTYDQLFEIAEPNGP